MQKNQLIEVFVEKNCRTCDEVLAVIAAFAAQVSVAVSVFDRECDPTVFRERRVLISPATFVNGRLAFYGNFSLGALRHHVQQSFQ